MYGLEVGSNVQETGFKVRLWLLKVNAPNLTISKGIP
jgi:hypothetical protein